MRPVAHIESPCREKFGIPRQSGLAPALVSRLVFEPEYRRAEAVRGLEGFSHIWLIWRFHLNDGRAWSPTVRPPRLGGNARMGVFATRSPFRPNPLGLSAVALKRVEPDAPEGPVLLLEGADLADGTPIYDIKPYLPYADAVPDARSGFVDEHASPLLAVRRAENLSLPEACTPEWLRTLEQLIAQDPRPACQRNTNRIHHLSLAPCEAAFRVEGCTAIIHSISPS